MLLNNDQPVITADFMTIFMENVPLADGPMQKHVLKTEKDKIDAVLYDSLQKVKTMAELKNLFEGYLLFYDTYQHYVTEDLALFFLNNVQSETKTTSEHLIKMQKERVDEIFYNKIKNAQTPEEINRIFKQYLIFIDAYQQYITEDLATMFLNKIHSDNESKSLHEIKRAKRKIDAVLIEKVCSAKTSKEVQKIFDNYLTFFDIYQEFISTYAN